MCKAVAYLLQQSQFHTFHYHFFGYNWNLCWQPFLPLTDVIPGLWNGLNSWTGLDCGLKFGLDFGWCAGGRRYHFQPFIPIHAVSSLLCHKSKTWRLVAVARLSRIRNLCHCRFQWQLVYLQPPVLTWPVDLQQLSSSSFGWLISLQYLVGWCYLVWY